MFFGLKKQAPVHRFDISECYNLGKKVLGYWSALGVCWKEEKGFEDAAVQAVLLTAVVSGQDSVCSW